jgi:hypothetical protein
MGSLIGVSVDFIPDRKGYRIRFWRTDMGCLVKNRYTDRDRGGYSSVLDAGESDRSDYFRDIEFSREIVKSIKVCKRQIDAAVTTLNIDSNALLVASKEMQETLEKAGCTMFAKDFYRWDYPGSGFDEIDTIYASDVGRDIIDALGYNFFFSDVYNPKKYGGEVIGEGSESIVYRVNFAGHECVVKLINKKGIEKMNEFGRMWRVSYIPPNYLYKFGKTEVVTSMLKVLQNDTPFRSFEIAGCPKDYICGKEFMIQEYVPWADLQKFEKQELLNSNWVKTFKEEISELEDRFFVTERERPYSPGVDFNLQDWIVFEENLQLSSDGRLKLYLVDQAPAGVSTSDWMFFCEQDERYAKLCDALVNDKMLGILRECKTQILN